MGAKLSTQYFYQSQPNFFYFVLNFPPNVPHKCTCGFLKFLVLEFLVLLCATAQQTVVTQASVVRPSVVRKTLFLRTRQAD